MKDKSEIQMHSDGCGRTAHAAINVKFYGRWPSMDGLDQNEQESVWESVVESFWEQAKGIAHDRGYSGVFSEGRSGGWMVPFYQRTTEGKTKFYNWPGQGGNLGYPTYPDVSQIGERSRFLAFQKRINALLSGVADFLKIEANFRLEEKRASETAQIQSDVLSRDPIL